MLRCGVSAPRLQLDTSATGTYGCVAISAEGDAAEYAAGEQQVSGGAAGEWGSLQRLELAVVVVVVVVVQLIE